MNKKICILIMFLLLVSCSQVYGNNLNVKYKTIDTSGYPLVVATFEVKDEDGALVRNIPLSHIHAAENHELLQNIRVESMKKNTNIVFVLDNSLSMKKYYREMKQDFFDIINLLDDKDRAGVVQLRGSPKIIQPLSKDKFKTLEKLSQIKKHGRADIFTGIKKAHEMLIEKNGGKEIILITDSIPTFNKLYRKQREIFETITHQMRVYGVRLHIIGLGHEADDDEIMDRLTLETGGQKLVHPNPHHLKHAFKQIIYSIPAHYRLSYISLQKKPLNSDYELCVKVKSKRFGWGRNQIRFRPY